MAIYQDSLEYYSRLNGVNAQFLRSHWDKNFIGKGWVFNYNAYVRHYIKPADVEGKNLEHYLELICPDGNRLQFKQLEVNELGAGTYDIQYDSSYYTGSMERALSMKITKDADGYRLQDLHHNHWQFDEDGLLTEISTLATRNTDRESLRVNHDGATIEIADSFGRSLQVATIPEGRLGYSGVLTIESPAGANLELTLNP